MTCRYIIRGFNKLILFVFLCALPYASMGATEEEIDDKRMRVAMRMIGHEILKSLGDSTSRVMPIKQIDNQYLIPFEFEFGFDPGTIVAIIDGVMTKSGIATDYLVEVEQCETKEVVHSFEIGIAFNPDMAPCQGRPLPKDCYQILLTILDGTYAITSIPISTSNGSSNYINTPSEASVGESAPITSEIKESNFFKSTYIIIPSLFLIGFIGYWLKKKNPAEPDPNLIMIGASRFDKKNMALTFENSSVELSNKEAELLSVLHTSANAPIERGVILQKVWGDEGDYVGRTLDVFISKLRKKLEADTSVKIVNIRGVGYKLVMNAPS